MVAGGALFAATQGLPITTGWYWAITTATTVGYGDVTPHNPAGRVVASLVMLTTIPMLGAAFALFTGSAVSSGMRRLLQMGSHFPEGSYRLVVGAHPAVPAIVAELVAARNAVVLVADIDPIQVPGEVHLIRGDPATAEALRSARPEHALHALIAAEHDGDALVSAVLLRQLAPQLPITALARSRSVAAALRELGVRQVLSTDELVAHTLAKSLEAPHAGDLLLELLESEQHRLVEQVIDEGAGPQSLSTLRDRRRELILGIIHDGKVSLGVGDDPEVKPGDVLLVVEERKRRSP